MKRKAILLGAMAAAAAFSGSAQTLVLKSGVWQKVAAPAATDVNFTFVVPPKASHVDCTASLTTGTSESAVPVTIRLLTSGGTPFAQGMGTSRFAKVMVYNPPAGTYTVVYRATSPATFNATCRTGLRR